MEVGGCFWGFWGVFSGALGGWFFGRFSALLQGFKGAEVFLKLVDNFRRLRLFREIFYV